MTILERLITDISQDKDTLSGNSRNIVEAIISLAESMLAIEKEDLQKEFDKGYQQGYTDAQGVY